MKPTPKSHRFLVWIIIILLPAILPGCGAIPFFGAPTQPSMQTGFAFVNGRYIEPPYQISVVNGDIQLNGQVIRSSPLPPANTPPPASPSASPQTAMDLVNIVSDRLQQWNITASSDVTPAIQSQLETVLKSYPAYASMIDTGTSIQVTDQAGTTAILYLDLPPLPTSDEVAAQQNEMAGEWAALLQSNGVLLVASSTMLEIPANQADSFIAKLIDIFNMSESERLDQLTQLTLDPSIAQSLLLSGPPPADLGGRLPKVIPTPPTIPSGGWIPASPWGGTFPAVYLMNYPQQASSGSHTPRSLHAYLFLTISGVDSKPVLEAARLHDYPAVVHDGNGKVSDFLDTSRGAQSGGLETAGILFVAAVGDSETLGIEQYYTVEAADEAVKKYTAQGIPVVEGAAKIPSPGQPPVAVFYVGIDKSTIARWIGAQTIVELIAQDTYPLGSAFLAAGAREFIAPEVGGKLTYGQANDFNSQFWPRVAGILDNGTKRNVIDAYAASPKYSLLHAGNGRTVLSPGVVSVIPPDGTSVAVGQKVNASITFDTPIEPVLEPLSLSGSCGSMDHSKNIGVFSVDGEGWSEDLRTFSFWFIPKQAGTMTLTAEPGTAFSDDNDANLDGNQNPPGTNHVGPNDDPYVWNLNCVAYNPNNGGQPQPPNPAEPGVTEAPPVVPGVTEAPAVTPTSPQVSTSAPATVPPPATQPPAAVKLRVTVLAHLANCRFGPDPGFGYVFGLRAGDLMDAVGRSSDGKWLLVQPISGRKNQAWISVEDQYGNAEVSVTGNVMDLPDQSANLSLPTSPLVTATSGSVTKSSGNGITAKWAPVAVVNGKAQAAANTPLYIFQYATLENGKTVYHTLSTNETSFNIPATLSGFAPIVGAKVYVQQTISNGVTAYAEAPLDVSAVSAP